MKIRKILLFPAFALIGSGLSGCSLLPTVTFYDEDGKTILEKDENVRLGSEISYDGKTPEKPADKQYVYTFDHWVIKGSEKELKEGDKAWGFNFEYKAVYTEEDRYYDITWLNGDGEELAKTKEKWGATPKSPEKIYDEEGDEIGEDPDKIPTKDQDDQYEYSFYRWNPKPYAVEGDQTYTPEFAPKTRLYKVIFNDADGKEMTQYTQSLEYGEEPEAPAINPTKETKSQEFRWEFIGWNPEIHAVYNSTNNVYNPVFKEVKQSYTVKFVNWNGDVLKEEVLEYGKMPEAPTVTPTKPANDDYAYTFSGWDKTITEVERDVVYTASFNAIHKYTVKFVNYNGDTLEEFVVLDGETTPVPSTNPSREHDNEYKYTFEGWSGDLSQPITGNTIFTAIYSKVRIYKIQFVDWDERLLKEEWVEEGKSPTPPSYPTREPDEYSYTCNKWDKDVQAATQNMVYQAVYESTPRKRCYLTYYLKFPGTSTYVLQDSGFYIDWVYEHENIDLPSFVPYHYDVKWYRNDHPGTQKPLISADDIYTNTPFYGVLSEHKFTVEFDFGGGSVSSVEHYPSEITYPETVVLGDIVEQPEMTGYNFDKWVDQNGNPVVSLQNVTSDLHLTAIYNAKSYEIEFNDPSVSGSVVAVYDSDSYFNNLPVPEKPGYTFDYWTYNNEKLEGDFTYTENITVEPVYHLDTYTLTYNLNNGSCTGLPNEYSIETFDADIPSPTKPGYTFLYWEVEINNEVYHINNESLEDKIADLFTSDLAGDFELTAIYDGPHQHTVSFDYGGGSPVYYVYLKDGNSVLDVQPVAKDVCTVEYASLPTPTKAGYQFAGWVDDNDHLLVNDALEINSDITLHAKWNPIFKPNDSSYAESISINGAGKTVSLYNLNGTFLQFTSLVNQTVTIETSTHFEVRVAGTENDSETPHTIYDKLCEINVDAGMSYSIIIAGSQNESATANVKITSSAASINPAFEISSADFTVPAPVACAYGEEIPGFVELARAGYQFDGWYIGSKRYEKGDVLDVDDDVTLVAHWYQIVTP